MAEYAEDETNPRNPIEFRLVKRVDLVGRSHLNPDGTLVLTPHVHVPDQKGVRPAQEDELP